MGDAPLITSTELDRFAADMAELDDSPAIVPGLLRRAARTIRHLEGLLADRRAS